jgi:hypothetical protein
LKLLIADGFAKRVLSYCYIRYQGCQKNRIHLATSMVPRLGACATLHVPYLTRFVFGAKLTSKAQIQCIILTSTTVIRR